MTSALQAGFGTTAITPPLGVELSGYGFYLDRRADGVLDPLHARCLVLDDSAARLVIVSCDLIGFTVGYADDVRRRIADACGTTNERVMLACTHTHSGPATLELIGLGVPDESYLALLPSRIVEACERALDDCAPAEVGWAVGEVAPIGFCRLPAPPDDYEDPPLGVLVCRRDRGDIGLVQYACHAVTLGVNKELSADYPGAVVRRMRERGVEALFLNGPCGDIDPLVNKAEWGSGTPGDVERYGCQLADRAAELIEELRYESPCTLSAHEKHIELRLRVPTAEEAAQTLAAARERWRDGGEAGDRFELAWAQRAVEMLHAGSAPPRLPFVVQVLGIGSLRLVGLSGEVYSSVGRAAMRAAGGDAIGVATANGVSGYIPHAASIDAHDDYGSNAAAKIYGHLPLEPNAPQMIAHAVAELVV